MKSIAVIVIAAVLSACAHFPPPAPDSSACAQNEASYDCQVERYNKVNAE